MIRIWRQLYSAVIGSEGKALLTDWLI